MAWLLGWRGIGELKEKGGVEVRNAKYYQRFTKELRMVTEQCSHDDAHATPKRGDAPMVGSAYPETMAVKGICKPVVL